MDLKEALSFYSEAGGKGDPALVQDEAATILQEVMRWHQRLQLPGVFKA